MVLEDKTPLIRGKAKKQLQQQSLYAQPWWSRLTAVAVVSYTIRRINENRLETLPCAYAVVKVPGIFTL